ncbi:MAG: AMP-binding protein, partial [Ruminiclostridium sp.]|nr:AMP-binding protein [Ruminiclostridium sp.]
IRRTEDEIEALICVHGLECRVIDVSDRFGDYGIVGVVITKKNEKKLYIDTFLLSCRVLGRCVEDAVLVGLGRYSRDNGITSIEARFYPTAKNKPFMEFMERTEWVKIDVNKTYIKYTLSVEKIPESIEFIECSYNTSWKKTEYLQSCINPQKRYDYEKLSDPKEMLQISEEYESNHNQNNWELNAVNEKNLLHKDHLLPIRNHSAQMLLKLPVYEVEKDIRRAEYVEPTNEMEEKLVGIWQEVLRVERIGVNDNFFELGGNSLSIIRIIAKVERELNVKLSYDDLIENNTVARLSGLILKCEMGKEVFTYPVIEPDLMNIGDPFPLTEIQTAYLIGRSGQFEMGGVSTHAYVEFETEINIQRFNRSFQKVINRHPMLRTIFLVDGKQKILPGLKEYMIIVEDLSYLDDDHKAEYIFKVREKMSHYVFKPDKWPLFEIKALKISGETHLVLISYDVLIADMFSMQIVLRETGEFYNNPDLELPELRITFRDYMLAYRELKNSRIYNIDKEYWLSKLDEFPSAPELPLKQKPSDIAKQNFKRLSKMFNEENWSKIKKIAKVNSVTPSVILLTAYAEVMSFWSNQPRLAINMTVFNRYPFHEDVDKIVGDFTSLILMDINLQSGNSFMEKAKRVQATLMENLEHRHYEGVEFIREITRRDNAGTRAAMPIVFTSALFNDSNTYGSFENQILQEDDSKNMSITQTPQVYIDNQAIERNGCLSIIWDYVSELFDEDVIKNIFAQYINMLSELNEYGEIREIKADYATESIVKQYNSTEGFIPSTTLHELFKGQAKRTPDNIAVAFENETISYRDLDLKSNQVAHYLREEGVKHNDLIGVMGKRSTNTIVNIMGILKAGAAYVPIEPEYPEERKNYIINNCNCGMLIEEDLYTKKYIGKYSESDIGKINSPEDTAYIIYTSGSTGKPKGVVITHKAAANTIIDINQKFNVNESDRILGVSSICFDLSVYDIFGTLSTGATLVLIADQRDVKKLVDVIEKQKITIWNSVPAIMDMVIEETDINTLNVYSEEISDIDIDEREYYWSPVMHWEKANDKILIRNCTCPRIALDIFPRFYFLTQKGILIKTLIDEFLAVDQEELKAFIKELIRNRVLVDSILTPQEIFSTQNTLFKNLYNDEIIYVAEESYKYKIKQLNRTHEYYEYGKITLDNNVEYPSYIARRRTYRTFNEALEISFKKFSQLLSIFKQKRIDKEIRYYYASAGGLYPIDVFVYVKKDRIENIKQGLYYYNPIDNSLGLVNDKIAISDKIYYFTNKSIFNASAFTIFLIYNAEANMPKYSSGGYFYACLDAGIMVSTVTQIAELLDIGLCSMGDIDFNRIKRYFKLNENQVLIHTIDGGLKTDMADDTEDVQGSLPEAALEIETAAKKVQVARKNGLRLALLSGDWIPLKLPEKIKRRYKGVEVISLGGATEASIWSIYHPVTEIKAEWKSIPYGKPLANQKMYILNYKMGLCPAGAAGEIYIGGMGVAQGYHDDEVKTRDAFITLPELGYLYRTGDYGVLHKEGFIEFLGRKDHQIKIRGYRIELGEIENQLLIHELIKETLVVAREDYNGKKYLCAYIVSSSVLTNEELRTYLRNKLPEYMIPSYFVKLEKMPLTPNGKIDRKALPEPERSIDIEYAAPQSEIEEKMVKIWQDVLGVGRIGINDNFFDMGGDSIKAMQILTRLNKCGLSIEIRDLFQHETIGELCSYIKVMDREINQSIVEGEVELTPIQKLFFGQKLTDIHHFSQAVMLYSRDGFDEKITRKVFDRIVVHHDALRMVYKREEEKVIQYNRGIGGEFYSLKVVDLIGDKNYKLKIEEEANILQGSMDFNEGMLLKIGLFKTAEIDYLLIIIHCLVIDGASWKIILEDLAAGYAEASRNNEIILQDKTDSFKEWSQKLYTYTKSKRLLEEVKYWGILEKTNITPLPKDNILKTIRIEDSDTVSMNLSEADTDILLDNVNKAYNTDINDILLTALGLAIKEWTGEDKVLISFEGNGRDEIIEGIDITRTVGCFTVVYPAILDMTKSEDLSYQIKIVKEGLRHIPYRGIGYGLLKYQTQEENKEFLKFYLKPEIRFKYYGQFDREIKPGTFDISHFSMGQAVNPDSDRQYALDINGILTGGKLTLTFTYNKNEYNKGTVLRLMKNYERNLQNIIGHCMEKQEKELTPTDFEDERLSIEELENIAELVSDL